MDNILDLIVIDDSNDDVDLLVRYLCKHGVNATARHVDTPATLLTALAHHTPDVVICDYSMPELNAPEAHAIVRAAGLDVPFIVCSGAIGEEAAVECMRAGAHDFIPKDRLQRLVPVIEREIAEAKTRAELRRTAVELRRADKLRALGQMAAGVSHDLRNLFNPMTLYLRLVERALDREQPNEARSHLAEVRVAITRATEALDRLRDYSRQAPEPPTEEVDLNHLVESAISLAHARIISLSAATVVNRRLGKIVPLELRSGEVLDALINLLINAIEALGETGGTILVSTGRVDKACFVEVRDDGPGMSAEVEARAFEPFFTTKGIEGTGLGLAMVYACMQRHQGRIEIETSSGNGTAFCLWFPVVEQRLNGEGNQAAL